MIKLLLFILVAVALIGMATGVLEVRVHQDRLSQVPSLLRNAIGNRSLVEQGRSYAVWLKRTGEQLIISDPNKKMDVALLYVRIDAARLDKLLAEHAAEPAVVIPQAKLLLQSLERVRSLTAEATPDSVVGLEQEAKETLASAAAVLSKLQVVKEAYEKLAVQFAGLVERIQQQLTTLDTENTPTSTPTITPVPSSSPGTPAIPLTF